MQVYGLIFCDIHFGSVTICNQFIFVLMFYVICHFTFFVVYKVVDAILLFVGKDTTFPRNFQGFLKKLGKDEEKEKIDDSRIGGESPIL